MTPGKPKLAIHWAASCWGCELAVGNIRAALLRAAIPVEVLFCPGLPATRSSDLEGLPDGGLLVTFFNGALRTEEDVAMAELLRRKSRLLVAFGVCAATGGVPALSRERRLAAGRIASRLTDPSEDPLAGLLSTPCAQAQRDLLLPVTLHRVEPLSQRVEVDFTMPGCPPEPEQLLALLRHVLSGRPLPVTSLLLGDSRHTLCDECSHEKRGAPPSALQPAPGATPEPGWCLQEQGFACLGPAIHAGCGALCPAVGLPCTGCYGTLGGPLDPAAQAQAGGEPCEREVALQGRLSGALVVVANPLETLYRQAMGAAWGIEWGPETPF